MFTARVVACVHRLRSGLRRHVWALVIALALTAFIGWAAFLWLAYAIHLPLRAYLYRARSAYKNVPGVAEALGSEKLSRLLTYPDMWLPPSEAERQVIAACLGHNLYRGIGTESALEALEYALFDDSSFSKQVAVHLIWVDVPEEALQIAMEAIVDLDRQDVRQVIIGNLSFDQYKPVVPYLIASLEAYPERAESTSRSLTNLTGEDHGESFEAWNAWYQESVRDTPNVITPEKILEEQVLRKTLRRIRLGRLSRRSL